MSIFLDGNLENRMQFLAVQLMRLNFVLKFCIKISKIDKSNILKLLVALKLISELLNILSSFRNFYYDFYVVL